MIFYKSTRTDGTDFHTGSVDYAAALASGEPLPELSGDGAFPGGGWYHLATTPTECVGMSWPCRLFEVEPVGETFTDNAHPHKIGSTSVRVIREVEAHRVFGPQGEHVAALIDRAARITPDEAEWLAAARDAAEDADWNAAWDAARGAAWYAARGAARDAARGAAWYAAWYAAEGAAWYAAWALVARDLIGQHDDWDQDAYTLLTGPWRRAIGPIHPDDAPMAGSSCSGI